MQTQAQPRRRLRDRSAQILEMLTAATLSPTQIARRLNVPKSTVFTIEARRKAKELQPAGAFQPRRVQLARCPDHGTLTVWPCVACAAQAAKGTGAAHSRPQLAASA